MTKKEIAQFLKQKRMEKGFEVKEVAERLIEMGAIKSVKSFYNWETGRTQPDADTFMLLCNLYGVADVMGSFGYKNENPQNNYCDEAQELYTAYQKASEGTKEAVRKLLDLTVSNKKSPRFGGLNITTISKMETVV